MRRTPLLTTFASSASSVLTSMVSWYELANVNDSASNANTLTNNATVTFGADYATFDSASSQSLTRASMTGLSANAGGTLAVWMKRNGNQGTFSGLIELGSSGADSIALAVNTTAVYVLGYHSSGLTVLTNETVNSTNATWTHYAVTWTGSAVKLYKDGALDASTSGFTVTFDGSFRLGRMTSQAYYKGDLKKAGVWNRDLTATEIGRVFAGTYPTF